MEYLTIGEAYKNLAEWLDVEEKDAHMRNMNCETCKDVIYRSIQILNDIRRLDLDFGDEIKTPYYEILIQSKTINHGRSN